MEGGRWRDRLDKKRNRGMKLLKTATEKVKQIKEKE